MSIDATNWAWRADVKTSPRRVVLLSLADRAGDDHKCFPSVARLAKDTCLDRKTVMKALEQLKDLGFILDTGETRGKGAKVYQLIGVYGRHDDQNIDESSTKNGTSNDELSDTKNGTSDKESSTKNGIGEDGKVSQISQEGVPNFPLSSTKNGTQNLSGNLPMNLSCQHEWIPNQNQLIGVLQQKGHQQNLKLIFGLPSFEFELGAFNAHFDGQVLSEGKKLYKFANWISDKFERHVKQHPEYIEVSQPEQPQQAPNTEFKGVRKTFKGMEQ
ncbi:helix-turn-helix domain-containing protein [Acinetobacter gerneri]|uniref:helix-turn-helix domain-containing protein n=1 Tax=Acinetobacter gerneri TaxID=202952 RepID=UPI0028A923DE|nr:helix-turn-helix domain-containing protein [Acinetobacter gerneri]